MLSHIIKGNTRDIFPPLPLHTNPYLPPLPFPPLPLPYNLMLYPTHK